MKRKLAMALGAVAALAILAPSQASAVNFQFQCPGCTTVGNGPTVYNDYLYQFTGPSTGTYGVLTVGTATGTFVVSIYSGLPTVDGDGKPTSAAYFTCTFVDPTDNSINDCQEAAAATGFAVVEGNQYYISAISSSPCTTGQGCNLVVMLDEGGDGTPDSTVPEPATMILLGTGLMGVAGARRRRKTQV